MAQMAVQKIVDAGTAPTFNPVTANDTAVIGSGHDSFVHVKNAGTGACTVTITDFYLNDDGDTTQPHVVTVANGAEALIPLRKSYDKGDGTGAQIAYSPITSVTSALVVVQ